MAPFDRRPQEWEQDDDGPSIMAVLFFGLIGATAATIAIIENQVLTVAMAVEDKLDEEISALDCLDLDDLEALRERRLQQMKNLTEKRSKWLALGHGEYTDISEKDFFATVKASDRVVCYFYRENWPCKVLQIMKWTPDMVGWLYTKALTVVLRLALTVILAAGQRM